MRRPRMFHLLTMLALAGWLVAAAGTTAHARQAQPDMHVRIDPAVRNVVQAEGEARVIINLRVAGGVRRVLADQRLVVRQAQAPVLSALPASAFALRHRYVTVPALSGTITAQGLALLERHPLVDSIQLDGQGGGALAESVAALGADVVHETYGMTGKGVTVAVLDTGVDTDHADLKSAIVAQHCFTANDCPNADGTPGTDAEGTSAEDGNGHGTHVTGIVASRGVVAPTGFAPDAKIAAVRVLDRFNSGFLSDWTAGLDWVADNQASLNIQIVNMSLGSYTLYDSTCDSAWPGMAAAVNQIVAAGGTVFAASGNAGNATRISAPACLSGVIAVGATYDADLGMQVNLGCSDATTSLDTIACFTNSNQQLDILAPGAAITSSYINGGAAVLRGTSMASPTAAGVAALMLQADPALRAEQIETILKSTGVPVTNPKNGRTFPRIDALKAMLELLFDSQASAPAARFAAPGAAATYTLAITNTGALTDSYELLLDGNVWPTSGPASIGPVAPAASTTASLTVTVPPTAELGTSDSVTVTLRSRGLPAEEHRLTLITTAQAFYGVEASPISLERIGQAGSVVSYTLALTNTATTTDAFDITLTGNMWETGVPASIGPVASGGTIPLTVTVQLPLDGAQTSDTVTITVRSRGNPLLSANATLTTRRRFDLYLPLATT